MQNITMCNGRRVAQLRAHLRRVVLTMSPLLLTACAMQPYPQLAPPYAYAQRDSLEQAYRAGVRDAYAVHGLHSVAGAVQVAAYPLALVAARSTGNFVVAPALMTVAGAATTVRALRVARQPVPAPPDSMRAHHELASEVLWQRYRMGFETTIYNSRQNELDRSMIFLGLSAALLVVFGTVRR
jgi:hypothetical protein